MSVKMRLWHRLTPDILFKHLTDKELQQSKLLVLSIKTQTDCSKKPSYQLTDHN